MGSHVIRLAVVVTLSCALSACARPRATTPDGPARNALLAARPYRLAAPASIDAQRSYPLVVVLHGLGSSSAKIESYYGLDELVDERGFFAAYPQGTEEKRRRHFWGGHRRFWNATNACCDFLPANVDDVAYLDAVIDDVSARHRVDAKRIFVMGLSNGGYMAYRYACDRAGRVAAIASQAGAMWQDPTRCQPSEPVAVLQIHGTEDDVVPYHGLGDGFPVRDRLPSAHQSVADWVAFDRCAANTDTAAPALDLVQDPGDFASGAAETTVERWTGCRGVELWTMHGAAHVPQPNRPFWARTIYDWLAAHPKP
jgi:polyhydroxybutyrate depolymerase